MTELEVLQGVRLKGRVALADLGHSAPTVENLIAAELLVGGTTVRLSPAGRARLADLLATERAGVDAATLAATYDVFGGLNTEFKALVSQWQLARATPDQRLDPDVLDQLTGIHHRVEPIIAAAATQIPRLASYGEKLDHALSRVRADGGGWLTRPIVDSYHTVWFELHEELIGATGRIRDADS